MRELANLSPAIIEAIVEELFVNFTAEQRNRLLNTAIALVNRSAAAQLLLAALPVLRGHPEAFEMWCNTGREIGLTSIAASEEYFRRSPEVLGEIHKEELGSWASLGIRIAGKSDQAAMEYFRASPRLLKSMALSDLIRWGQEGYGLFREDDPSSVRAAIEYFALGTRRSVEHMRSGYMASLEEFGRALKLYAEAISGGDIAVQPTNDSFRTDGKSLYLPVSLTVFRDREDNFRLYRALTARLVGHVVYGSFDLELGRIEANVEEIARRYGSKIDAGDRGVEAFLKLYPDLHLAAEIYEMLEDARVERRLRRDYRGIGKDLDLLGYAPVRKFSLEELTPPQAILQVLTETLLLGAIPEDSPPRIADIVRQCLAICEESGDRVEDTALATDRIYQVLEAVPHPIVSDNRSSGKFRKMGAARQHGVKGKTKSLGPPSWGMGSRPTDLWPGKIGAATSRMEGIDLRSMGRPRVGPRLRRVLTSISQRARGIRVPASRRGETIEPRKKAGEQVLRYDEWDHRIGDYRKAWCTVREVIASSGSTRFTDNALASYSSLVSAVRREFQLFKPERLRKEKKQADGDEIDVDAMVELYSELKGGSPIIEGRIYTRRSKIERDIATAFLVDLSGSTAGWVIDTEKKALVVMCEALEAIGDRYAIYGFSGATRDDVAFHIVKDFDEAYGDAIKGRIGNMGSLSQNRDGAAIRNAMRRLEGSGSKTKLLVVISDGHPLDMMPRPGEPLYQGEYSRQDTRMALKEARLRGIRPFCITVDKEAMDYISLMYADVNYTIIDDVAKLPERMPAIYRRLTT
jgi:hypothetical protein